MLDTDISNKTHNNSKLYRLYTECTHYRAVTYIHCWLLHNTVRT